MELIGRRTEVDRITTLAALPRESALVVVGDPGLGRSTLLDAATSRVSLPVVRVGVNASESRWPLSGVTTLFAAFDDPRAAAHAARLVHGTTAADGSSVEGLAAAHEFLDAVRALALPPTLVLIDDLDLMDEESQELVAFLAGRLSGTALRIVATVRSACSEGPLAALPSMPLEPLAADEALLLARALAPADANDGVLAVLAAETGGNPKALREQLGMLRREQLLGTEPLIVPLRPTPTVDAVAKRALACAEAADLEVLARLALTPCARFPGVGWDRDTIDDLVDTGLVAIRGQSAAVRDPLVRSHLHWRTSARERRALHTELAAAAATPTEQATPSEQAAPGEQATGEHAATPHASVHDARAAAWHRSFVDVQPDAVALLVAARGYAVDGVPASAIELTERALHVGTGSHAEQVALLAVAEVLLAHRLLAYAARYLAAIRPFPALPEDARRLRLQYSVQYLSGEAVHADELLVPIDAADTAEADALTGLLAMVACFRAEAWEVEQARDLVQRAEPFAAVASEHTREMTAAARDMIAAVDGTLAPDAELHDGLAATTLLALSDPALLLLAHALSLGERYRSARRVFALVLARATHTAPVWIEAARYLSAENEVRSGNVRQALRAIDVWEAGSTVVERLREPSRAIAIAWRHFAEGRPQDALVVLDQCLANRSTNRLWGATAKLHALRGRVLLGEERLPEAIAALEAADAIGRTLRNPTVLRHLGDLVEVYVRVGRTDDARRVASRLAADHHARPSRWGALVLARCLALVADDTTRTAARRRALEVFEPADSQYERGRTLAALSTFGVAEDRARLGAAAAAAFEAAGLRRPPVAAPQRPSVPMGVGLSVPAFGAFVASASAPSPRSAPDASVILTMLTPEERAVAQKVTEGYRNKEIASTLYMSQRTVELRLTQIYRKVGARSRSHLVALLT